MKRNAGFINGFLYVTVLFSLACATRPLFAHSLDEVEEVLSSKTGQIPRALLEITRTLNSTAGTEAARNRLHVQQHRFLLDHVRRQTIRRCDELVASLPHLDQDISRFQEQEPGEEEQLLRDIRDQAQSFVAMNCRTANAERQND